ncbi:hypothetical protein SFUMM280S_06955 [Streptomyces fumanus]
MTAAHADLQIDCPRVTDGAALWRMARDSKVLDLNSSYSYLLWCRDFAATSAVARAESGEAVGFVTGYVRPDRPDTLFVWQVAVDAAYRGRGLAAALLDGLAARLVAQRGLTTLENHHQPGQLRLAAAVRLVRRAARRLRWWRGAVRRRSVPRRTARAQGPAPYRPPVARPLTPDPLTHFDPPHPLTPSPTRSVSP